MKSAAGQTNRMTVSSLHTLLRQTNAKIDILETRLAAMEETTRGQQKESPMEEAFIKARERIVLTQRASKAIWKGVRAAGVDLMTSFQRVVDIMKDGGDDAGRDMETTFKRSKAAIQGGLAKARQDVDKSAKVAMHIVNG